MWIHALPSNRPTDDMPFGLLSSITLVTFQALKFICLVVLFDRADSLKKNQDLEFERNKERFEFLKVRAELGSIDWFFIRVGREGEVSCVNVCLAFTVFLPFLNPSGALRPFATWGLFHRAQESSTRWIWSIWQEWSLIRMDITTQTALWAQIHTPPWLMVWVSLVGVSVFLGFYSVYADLWHGLRYTLIPLHSSSMNLSDQQISERYFCLFFLLLYFQYPEKCFVPFTQSVWCLEEWIGTRG